MSLFVAVGTHPKVHTIDYPVLNMIIFIINRIHQVNHDYPVAPDTDVANPVGKVRCPIMT